MRFFIKKHPGLVLFCICAVLVSVRLATRGEYVAAIWPTLAAVFDFCATLFSDIMDEQHEIIEELLEENEKLKQNDGPQ